MTDTATATEGDGEARYLPSSSLERLNWLESREADTAARRLDRDISYQSLPSVLFCSQQIRNIFRLSVPSKIHREGCLRLCSFPAVWFYIISAAIHWHHCWLSWSDLAVPGQVWCQVISAPRLSGAQVPSQGCVRMDLRTPAAIINLSDMEITSESTVVSSFPSYL